MVQKSSAWRRGMSAVAICPHSGHVTRSVAKAARVRSAHVGERQRPGGNGTRVALEGTDRYPDNLGGRLPRRCGEHPGTRADRWVSRLAIISAATSAWRPNNRVRGDGTACSSSSRRTSGGSWGHGGYAMPFCPWTSSPRSRSHRCSGDATSTPNVRYVTNWHRREGEEPLLSYLVSRNANLGPVLPAAASARRRRSARSRSSAAPLFAPVSTCVPERVADRELAVNA